MPPTPLEASWVWFGVLRRAVLAVLRLFGVSRLRAVLAVLRLFGVSRLVFPTRRPPPSRGSGFVLSRAPGSLSTGCDSILLNHHFLADPLAVLARRMS